MKPDMIEAMEKRAEIHFKKEEFEECIVECEEILSKKPSPSIEKLKKEAESKQSSNNPWWKILKVDQNATKAQVIHSFKKLAKLFHPDKVKGSTLKSDKKKMTKKMAKINGAKQEFDKR
jgi:preprotein translocase subunit Sec63